MAEPWMPNLFGKQIDIFNDRSPVHLVSGTRWASKTWSCLHKLVRHMWETPSGEVGIFAHSVKLAKDSGTWKLLLRNILPEWFNANLIGETGERMEMLTKNAEGQPDAKVDANTRTAYFEIRNYYGQPCRCSLFSINNDNEIDEAIKNKNFSMEFFIELSMWKEAKILPITLMSLRMPGLTHIEHLYLSWLADTNPDEELGRESWIYKAFYQRLKPNMDSLPEEDRALLDQYWDMLKVTEMHWKDNPFCTPFTRAKLLGSCHNDPALLDSYYHGIWGDGGFKVEKHFTGFFVKSKHVIGGHDGEGDQIDVAAGTVELYSGWDLGGTNHGVVMLEKIVTKVGEDETSTWNVMDEIMSIGEELSLAKITLQFMVQMDSIQKLTGKKYQWKHWSDDSAINVFRPNTNTYDYIEVLAASAGLIELQGVSKPQKSVQVRVRILKQLLRENRIFISSRCHNVIAMLEHLRKSDKDYVVRDHKYIHIFDALTYPLFMECQKEYFATIMKPQATAHAEAGAVISL